MPTPYQKGARRTCQTEGCSTKLSRYNPGNHCFAHDDPRDEERSNAYAFRIDREIREDLRNLRGPS